MLWILRHQKMNYNNSYIYHMPNPLKAWGFPGWLDGNESACNAGDPGSIPGLGRSHGEGNAAHSSILAWRFPWTEEPGGLQSMGSQRVGPCQETITFTFFSTSAFHGREAGQRKFLSFTRDPRPDSINSTFNHCVPFTI